MRVDRRTVALTIAGLLLVGGLVYSVADAVNKAGEEAPAVASPPMAARGQPTSGEVSRDVRRAERFAVARDYLLETGRIDPTMSDNEISDAVRRLLHDPDVRQEVRDAMRSHWFAQAREYLIEIGEVDASLSDAQIDAAVREALTNDSVREAIRNEVRARRLVEKAGAASTPGIGSTFRY